MANILKTIIENDKGEIRRLEKMADKVFKYEDQMAALTDDQLKAKTVEFKERYQNGESLDSLLYEAFAVVREGAKRVLGLFPYKVQVMGGIVLHHGDVPEMRTGEGKTLTATMPVYLNALSGKGVHVVTVNEYLSERDATEMGELYSWLGLSVGINLAAKSPMEKKEAYECDITYSTNSEIGFDYLRDNMVVRAENMVQRPLNYALVDEVDSILIDEARTPLIVSGANAVETSQLYHMADHYVKSLDKDDYIIDVQSKTIGLSDSGIDKAESYFKLENLYDIENVALTHFIDNALRANYIMLLDIDYVVSEEQEILIVDQFTGRTMEGRRYSDGLHQAIEAKEGVPIQDETKTSASITYQNLFRMYKKLSGMTGTGKTEEEEFREIYNIRVIPIPTNRPVQRIDHPDLLFASIEAKFKAVVEDVKARYQKGQPVLVGTVAVETSDYISKKLVAAGVPHEVLNAKNHYKEAQIIMNAGQRGAVTIATNMAGRGTDIKLGEGVRELGGLCVIGTERHESRRIDNQLRGRSGRQGDPGESQGLGEPLPISSVHGIGTGDVLDAIVENLPNEYEEENPDVIKFSLIGRPNVGKSSLINAILGEDRVIASPVAGTTRDAIDTHFTDADGQEFTMIDTAGMRKSGKVYENTEKYSVMRAMRAIDRSDVVLMVINAEEGIREYDKRIAGFAHEAGKGMIIVVNKWDTLEKDNHTMKKWEEDIREQFQYLPYAPIIFVSALTKQRLHKLPEMIKQISESQNTRIPSAVLNDVIMDAIAINPTPTDKGKRLKIFYATQVATKPPTFVIFVNEEELMHFSYLRFLENQIRKAFVFEGTPIHLIARKRK